MGTLEVLEAIRRRWNLAGAQVNYGGLKDRHAVTVQYLTILDGPDRALRETSFALEPLGRLPHPYGPEHFRGNRFAIVLRDLGAEAAARAERAAGQLPRDGLPNYFDDQRFGSVGFDGGFIAEAWLKGTTSVPCDWRSPSPTPRSSRDAGEKAILRDLWGRWPRPRPGLPRSPRPEPGHVPRRPPTDFRGAFARVRRDLRSLYFSAYQSYLWNLILAA